MSEMMVLQILGTIIAAGLVVWKTVDAVLKKVLNGGRTTCAIHGEMVQRLQRMEDKLDALKDRLIEGR